MKIKLLTFCFLLAALQAFAQNANQRIGACLNEGRWFDLQHELKVTPPDSVLPWVWKMAVACTHHYFNRPDSAYITLEDLTRNHQKELGYNALNMMGMMGMNLSRMGQYKEAAELMQSLYDQLKVLKMDTRAASFQHTAQYYKTYAAYSPVCQPLHPTGEYHIPMLINNEAHSFGKSTPSKSHFIAMKGRINGKEEELIFDTGAAGNVMSSRQARNYGLHFSDSYFNAKGIGYQKGLIAFADTLQIGDMTWINVPFVILDAQTGNAKADSAQNQLRPVIGLPIMQSMQEIQMDFAHREFVIPAQLTPNPLGESNLILQDNENLEIASQDEEGHPLYFHFDTGSYYTQLYSSWYRQHQTEVESIGTLDTLRIGGAGGVYITLNYRLPQVKFHVGQGEATLRQVYVDTGIGLDGQPQPQLTDTESMPNVKGIMGLDLMEQFGKVILNLKDMYLEGIP